MDRATKWLFVLETLLAVASTASFFDLPAPWMHDATAKGEEYDYASLVDMTTTEIIQEMGYHSEIHHVISKDGYILELHRIPYGMRETYTRRPVAFLHHCLLCSSSDWVMNTPDKALAYLLADAGYDVWITNSRGNTYSRNHTSYDPDEDSEFWNFSWHEMAVYDMPAVIDYILGATQQKKVYYVGFSMGTTVFFAFMSEYPEYQSKICAMAALAPVAYVTHLRGPSRTLATLHKIGILEEFFPVILSHTPAGTSLKTVLHYLQEYQSGKFQPYDNGLSTPREYNVTNINIPIALFWSDNDWFASNPRDVRRLERELPNVVLSRRIANSEFTHLDFVW